MSAEHQVMDIVGYADRLSGAPGNTIEFKVSCLQPGYESTLVRLIHGDTNPAGPGYKEERIPSAIDDTRAGRRQPLRHGSHMLVADPGSTLRLPSFSLQCWVLPTAPERGVQGVLTRWANDVGYGLFVDDDACLALWVGGEGRVERLASGSPLRHAWYFAGATYDAETGHMCLCQIPLREFPHDRLPGHVERRVSPFAPDDPQRPFLVAAAGGETHEDVAWHFNGKIDRPRVFSSAATRDELEALRTGASPHQVEPDLAAAWDLGSDPSDDHVVDLGSAGLGGTLVNMPTRGVTGHNWTGRQTHFALAPDEYGAIHFHEDDLTDARWETDFSLTVPEGLPSGIYAAHLRSPAGEDHVPFVVRPPRGQPTARILLVIPTFTYLAYANEHITWTTEPAPYEGVAANLQPEDHFAIQARLLSMYDSHADGSGVCYSSSARPIVNMRPKYAMPLIRSPHLLGADLHLTDWMEVKGFEFDVVTDHDLHEEGLELLKPYSVVVSGSHPEYVSVEILEAIDDYLAAGGRIMYMGGNGYYWVTSLASEQPVIEVRRGHVGSGTWRSAPGEEHHSTTGERGGLWRNRGWAPQRLFGVGFTAAGYYPDMPPYRRTAASRDPRAAWIFEGVADDPLIGDTGLVLNGAAGFEIDRADTGLGTPEHALVIAEAIGFSDNYQSVSEEILLSDSLQGGPVSPTVRADVLYYEGPNDGAVFSVGSISWCGSLSQDSYGSDVSRITENVLRRFSS